MPGAIFQPLTSYVEYPIGEMKQRAIAFREEMQRRRTVRDFSNRPVPREVIEECLLVAGGAPSGANLQPWHFVVVSDPRQSMRFGSPQSRKRRSFIIDAPLRNGWMHWR